MEFDSRVQVPPGVVFTQNGGSSFLTNLESGAVYELNATACEVMHEIRRGATVADLVGACKVKYPEIPQEEIERDVRDMLSELVNFSLIKVVP